MFLLEYLYIVIAQVNNQAHLSMPVCPLGAPTWILSLYLLSPYCARSSLVRGYPCLCPVGALPSITRTAYSKRLSKALAHFIPLGHCRVLQGPLTRNASARLSRISSRWGTAEHHKDRLLEMPQQGSCAFHPVETLPSITRTASCTAPTGLTHR